MQFYKSETLILPCLFDNAKSSPYNHGCAALWLLLVLGRILPRYKGQTYHTLFMAMNKLKLQPLGDRVAVAPVAERKLASGILIPETASKERPEQGKVIAVGPGRLTDDGKRVPISLKVGDQVLFSKYGPEEIKIDGAHYYLLREDQVLAIIK